MGHWLVDTAGIGSLVVMGVGCFVLIAYVTMLRWIQSAPRDPVPLEIDVKDGGSIMNETGGEEV